MQLESHALPPQESPQQRYAALHRAIERGLDSDEIWRELAGVALTLGHGDEAVRCARRITNDSLRFALESALARRGYAISPVPAADPATSAPHRRAPAASDAGTGGDAARPTLRDHVVDAFQYLFHQHMPWVVLFTTLAFPLVVGLGGILTAGNTPILLAAIAALPGLCVVAVLGAMSRRILGASVEGNGDVPALPGFGELAADARQFFLDGTIVLGSLLGPSLLGLCLGAPLTSTLPGLAIGLFFVPMAASLRHLGQGMAALSPVQLLRGLARTGWSYAGLAIVSTVLFAPAIVVGAVALGHPVWVQIAVVGPLLVLPLFVVARLVGTWLDVHRHLLVRGVAPRAEAKAQPAAAPAKRAPAAEPASRTPRRPESLERFRAPVVGRERQRARAATKPPAPRSIEGRQPQSRPATTPAETVRQALAKPTVAAKAAVHRPAPAARPR